MPVSSVRSAPENTPPARSIAAPPPVGPERLNQGRPILAPVAAHPWESRVVLNPAGQLVEGDALEALLPKWDLAAPEAARLRETGGAVVLLYRAQGAVDEALGVAPSSLGWAVFTPLMEPVARRPEPVLAPSGEHNNLGLEDARCTRVGDTYHLYYTGYSDPTPEDEADRRVLICHATSRDLVRWEDHGPASGGLNEVNNKNAALFAGTAGRDYVLTHRPMEGENAMAVHWATAPDPAGPWTSRGCLFESYDYEEFERSWVGAGGPPLALHGENGQSARFLMVYHQGHYAPDGSREYDLAAALLDLSREDPVVSRIEPLMRPTGAMEQEGDDDLGVDNVLFTCANHRWRGDLVIPYAGADSRIFAARVEEAALVEALEASAR